jgi:hypothetical protein
MSYGRKLGIVALGAAAVVGMTVAPAWAAQMEQQVSCDGHELTIRSNENNSSDHGGWSSVQIVQGGSGHLTPVAFSGSLYDVTTESEIFSFSQAKGGGHAAHNTATTTCTQEEQGTLADFLEPGDELPPGASPDDDVTFTFTATVTQH